MMGGILFQDFAPVYLTDLIPYCNVFLQFKKCYPYLPAWYHIDEQMTIR